MADKRAVGHAYNIDFLNVVFAASSLFLFMSVLWMVWDDFDREWKNTQRRFVQLESEVTQANLDRIQRGVDRTRLQKLEAERAAAGKQVEANQARVNDLQGQLQQTENQLYRNTQNYQFAKANYDSARYDFEVLRNQNPERARAREAQIAEQSRRVDELNLVRERAEAERDRVRQELGKYTGQAAAAATQIAELNRDADRLRGRLTAIQPSLVKDLVLNAPLLDFMAPTLKIQQVILPNIVDDVNFTRVPKMDRCQTCHLSIDRRGYEKYPQPYQTHSNLEIYLGSQSPHPLLQIGCTACHDGMGQSVSFRDAAHTPRNHEEEERWRQQYHWEEPHLWDYPMLPVGMTEASCVKCHKNETYVADAPKLQTAYLTFERAGCYACHKTRGFEDLRKPGPILTRIKSKLTPEWVKTWIRNPRAVKPSTWMPKIWHTSNSNGPADMVRNEIEIDATVSYLFEHSDDYRLPVSSPPRGDAKRGEAVVRSIGCLGCHVIDESRVQAGPRRTFGQPLQSLGNKTTYEWLYNWVKDPKHFSPGTFMPNLRLDDQQVADVATYLMTLKGPEGEGPKATYDPQAADEVLLDYFKAVMPADEAEAKLKGLDARARHLALGERVIGRYGCFSCHEIKGFEKTQAIGTELSEEGSKLVSRLDFAFVEIPHTKLSWFHQKLLDPRTFDHNKELRPLEKLRMPDFGLAQEEAGRLELAILSFQRDIQPAAASPLRTARTEALYVGRTFVQRRNCVTCHQIEKVGGDFKQLVADPSLAPPLLTPEGAKVQPDWLYAFLQGPITIRPWLNVRMPTFGLADPDWNKVLRYFGGISDTVGPFRSHDVVLTSNTINAGKDLFQLLRCQQCHVLGEIPKDQPTANLAPDLRMTTDRLQPDWIPQWLKNPGAIQPGTRMPAFWPDFPKSPFPQLAGSAEEQILAIRNYLLTFRGGPTPKRLTAPQVAPN
ncbi:MAG: c-type cytochrome [Acidobacteria bacterium]|nr:c-type cytochrome [Acidobacteriota bacterium]